MSLMRLAAIALLSAACAADSITAEGQTAGAPAAQQKSTEQKPAGTSGTAAPVDSSAVIAGFHERMNSYVEIRKQAMKDAPKPKESEDPGKIKEAQDALAARLAALRASAKAGDILTPETQATFRRLLAPELKGEDGRDAKALMKDDAPAPGQVPLKVNARYPEGTPLPTVAPTMLRSLPILPEGIEYRFIGKDLILLDMDAQIVIDFMRNAIR